MKESERDYAIVVGLHQYEIKGDTPPGLFEAPLSFYRWLIDDPHGPRLPKDNVIGVGNVGATDHDRGQVDKAFDRMLEQRGRRLYVYMSGVGAVFDKGVALLSPKGTAGAEYPPMPLFEYAEGVRRHSDFEEIVFLADCFRGAAAGEVKPPRFFVGSSSDRPHFYAWAEDGIPHFTDTVLGALRDGVSDTESLKRYLGKHGMGDTVRFMSGNLAFPQPRREEPQQPKQPEPAYRAERVAAHADDPAVVDELGRRPFAEVIGARIVEVRERLRKRENAKKQADTATKDDEEPVQSRDLAFMVHLHGPWGSGKTSVLNFLRAYLKQLPEPWIVVDFNAWRHQRMRPPWWALIRKIYSEAGPQLGFHPRRVLLWATWWVWRLFTDITPLLTTIGLIVLAVLLLSDQLNVRGTIEPALKVITAIAAAAGVVWTFSRSLVFGSARAAQTYTELRTDPLSPIVRLFKALIRAAGRPVAVFVDDLDRCDAKYVIELIEGIQTLFRSAPVTYVVAADRKWICSSFEQVYTDFGGTIGEPGRPLGYLFLEKVFQVSASVPRLSKDVQDAYWAGLLRTGDAVDPATLETKRKAAEAEAAEVMSDATTHEELTKAVHEAKGDAIEKAAYRAAAAKQITTPEAQKETEHRLHEFAGLLEPNPRAMKRLVNAYGLHQAAHFLEGRSVAPEALARWTIVELRWPLLADHLAAHPEAVASIGKDAAAVPAELKPLFTNEEVCAVVGGGLGEAEIRTIIGRW